MEAQLENLSGTMNEELNLSAPSATKATKLGKNPNRTFPCIYCNGTDHAPRFCPRYSSIDQRLQLIRKIRLCQNYESSEHRTKNCSRGACRQCKEKGHHTSICQKSFKSQPSTIQSAEDALQKAHSEGHATKRTAAKQNTMTSDAERSSTLSQINDETRQHQQEAKRTEEDSEDLLVGQARVCNARTQELEDVYIVLDTGANRSFITNDFAEHLGLPKTGQLQLTIQTFGNSSAKNQSCEKTQIEIEDRHGTRHKFELARIDFITGDLKQTPLLEEDRQHLQLHNIKLSIPPQIQTLQTPILLGYGDLFTLFGQGFESEHILPSGVRLLHSKIGYLIAGRNNIAPLDAQINEFQSHPTVDDRSSCSGAYWSLESAGIEVYTRTQTEERHTINDKIWKQFRATAQRHDDGHYVRLP
uniref:DUF1758 domain-containing protein n=1 Tax=Haemonchus contortus TaxID=6289 RepID=A0A7I4YEB8_HAECO